MLSCCGEGRLESAPEGADTCAWEEQEGGREFARGCELLRMEQSAGVAEGLSRTRMSKDLLETLCRLSCRPTPRVQQCLSLRMPQEIGEGDVVEVQTEFPMWLFMARKRGLTEAAGGSIPMLIQ